MLKDKLFSKSNINIDLSKKIYDIEKIKNVVTTYSDIAKFKVEEIGEYYRVHLIGSKYDGRVTLKEFENYLIDSMN